MLDATLTHARTRLSRHLRSPALLWLAIAAPIVAPFLVPAEDASYALIGVNDKTLALDAGSLGLQLGVLTATLMTPLAWIYLRAGAGRRQPREVQYVSPGSRPALQLGGFVGDTAALWLWALALAIAGIILSIFRVDTLAPLQTLVAVFIISAPALAVIAGLRAFCSSLPFLRGWAGDVLFFIVWMAGISVAAAFFATGEDQPLMDVFGFSAPLVYAAPEPVTEYYIGGSPKSSGLLRIDTMAGVLNANYLASRAIWIALSGGLALLGGLLFKASRPKPGRTAPTSYADPVFTGLPIAPVTATGSPLTVWLSDLRLILNSRIKLALFILGTVAAAALPFRGLGGAIALFALIVLLAGPAATFSRTRLLDTVPVSRLTQWAQTALAMWIISLLMLAPALIRAMITGDSLSAQDAGLSLLLVAPILFAFATLTRSAFGGRVLGLIAWYGYLNLAVSG